MGNFIKSFTKELDQSACQSACFHIVVSRKISFLRSHAAFHQICPVQ